MSETYKQPTRDDIISDQLYTQGIEKLIEHFDDCNEAMWLSQVELHGGTASAAGLIHFAAAELNSIVETTPTSSVTVMEHAETGDVKGKLLNDYITGIRHGSIVDDEGVVSGERTILTLDTANCVCVCEVDYNPTDGYRSEDLQSGSLAMLAKNPLNETLGEAIFFLFDGDKAVVLMNGYDDDKDPIEALQEVPEVFHWFRQQSELKFGL